MPEILTFGEALAVFYPSSGETLARGVGGAELNVAVHLALRGRAVTYVTRVGDDPFGAAIRARLEQAGVDARVEVDPDRRTGIYFREVALAGPRRVYYYRTGSAASVLRPETLPPLDAYRLVHATGITAALGEGALAAVERASHARGFSLDVNFRPALWSATDCRAALVPLLSRAELVFVSEEDAEVISPESALEAGAAAVVHTRGEAGATFLSSSGHRYDVPAPRVDVVDAVGTGDAFAAGFLDAWLAGSGPEGALEAGCVLGSAVAAAAGDS